MDCADGDITHNRVRVCMTMVAMATHREAGRAFLQGGVPIVCKCSNQQQLMWQAVTDAIWESFWQGWDWCGHFWPILLCGIKPEVHNTVIDLCYLQKNIWSFGMSSDQGETSSQYLYTGVVLYVKEYQKRESVSEGETNKPFISATPHSSQDQQESKIKLVSSHSVHTGSGHHKTTKSGCHTSCPANGKALEPLD